MSRRNRIDVFEVNRIYNENCLDTMARMPTGLVNLTVTSPPYDNLRDYKGYSFDFPSIARELYRVTANGGVVVWNVNDETVDGGESGTSFRQALYFMEIGFKLNDTMIYAKPGFTGVGALKCRYAQTFEYMFVLVKGKLKTFNPIKDRKVVGTFTKQSSARGADGTIRRSTVSVSGKGGYGIRYNIWTITPQGYNGHPAPFPEQLANDHIITWSNKGDLVYDPFLGSGTTARMARLNGRDWVGSEISDEYSKLALARIMHGHRPRTRSSAPGLFKQD